MTKKDLQEKLLHDIKSRKHASGTQLHGRDGEYDYMTNTVRVDYVMPEGFEPVVEATHPVPMTGPGGRRLGRWGHYVMTMKSGESIGGLDVKAAACFNASAKRHGFRAKRKMYKDGTIRVWIIKEKA